MFILNFGKEISQFSKLGQNGYFFGLSDFEYDDKKLYLGYNNIFGLKI